MTRSEGVYFLANDAVYEWAMAFLNSFRAFNPSMPLLLIPFDATIHRLKRLASRYQFNVFEDESIPQLEAIGRTLELGVTKTGPAWFRRFAAFWGPFENFLYLDARVLVLSDLTPFIRAPGHGSVDLAYYDRVPGQVYNPGQLKEQMRAAGAPPEFASNIWAARAGLVTLPDLEQAARELIPKRADLNRRNTDQFFLNYLCVAQRWRTAAFPDLIEGLVERCWSRDLEVYRSCDGYRNWDHGGLSHQQRVALINWAGLKLSPAMPNDALHFKFRCVGCEGLGRSLLQCGRLLGRSTIRFVDAIRRNRWINTTYHRLRGRA